MEDQDSLVSGEEREVIIELDRMAGIPINELSGPTKAPAIFAGYLLDKGRITHLSNYTKEGKTNYNLPKRSHFSNSRAIISNSGGDGSFIMTIFLPSS